MQRLKEMPNGNRVPVSEQTYMQDKFDRDFVQIISHETILVYRLAKQGSRPAERVYSYGGRNSNKGMHGRVYC